MLYLGRDRQELGPMSLETLYPDFILPSASFCYFAVGQPWFVVVALFIAAFYLSTHCSRQRFLGFKVALDDEETAEGWLFWDDGQSIGE